MSYARLREDLVPNLIEKVPFKISRNHQVDYLTNQVGSLLQTDCFYGAFLLRLNPDLILNKLMVDFRFDLYNFLSTPDLVAIPACRDLRASRPRVHRVRDSIYLPTKLTRCQEGLL